MTNHPSFMPRFASLFFLLLLVSIIINSKYAFADPYTDVQSITSVTHSVVQDNGHYPPEFRVPQTINLPHNASVRPSTSAWYQFTFHITDKPTQNLALFLPLINMKASIYLNHQLIGASGSFNEPMSRFWHTPVLFHLPLSSLQRGKNTLYIRLKASPPNDLTQLGLQHVCTNLLHQLHHPPDGIIRRTFPWFYHLIFMVFTPR